jgi:tetratricopeptide (TPR) repeat protein
VGLQRLSILAGTWTLEAAESIASLNELTSESPLDLVTHLLDKSLLVADTHAGETRYRMLEIIRQYAFEKLQLSNQVEAVQDQHTRYYLALAQKARPLWSTPAHAQLMKQFDADYPNLQAALAWGLKDPNRIPHWEHGVKLAIEMGPLWNFLGEYRVGQMWLEKVIDQINTNLAQAETGSEKSRGLLSLKAKALYEYGFLVWFQSYYVRAGAIFKEASEIFLEVDDATGLAYSNMFLAHSIWGSGDRERARSLWVQSLEQFQKVGDLWGMGMVHSFIGRAERESDHLERAKWNYGQCLELFGAVGDGWGLGIALSHLGMIAFQQGDPEQAQKLFEQRLSISRQNGFRQSAAYSLVLLGVVAWKLGDAAQVKNHMLEALPYFTRLGNYVLFGDALVGLAWAEAEMGHPAQAAYLVGAVENADQNHRTGVTFEDIYFHQPILNDLQSRESIRGFQAEIEKGRNSTLDEVTKEIL